MRVAMARGVRVLSVDAAGGAATSQMVAVRFPLLLFSQELLALLEAGLNLNEALTTLEAKERRPAVRQVLAQLLAALREGKSLSDALKQFPDHFPEVYAATIRAAERTGDMAAALGRYITYQIQFDAIRKKLVSALIYPVMLLAVGTFVILFLVGYVVPKFSVAYQSAGRDIPFASQALLAVGRAIHAHWSLVFAGFVSLVLLAVLAWRQQSWRQRALDMVLRMPWLAARADDFRVARLFGAVSLLLSAGIPLVRALPMVSGLLGLEQRARLALAQQEVESGRPFSVALVAHRLAGPVAESLVKVGERSGRLADMLERAARFHDEDFARWMDWASRLLEPILMVLIGLVVGAVVVLMYMPIFELAGSMQ
ncbi:MAG TPA: type II secretion system F family protein [Rhodocyclaceae bacterium]